MVSRRVVVGRRKERSRLTNQLLLEKTCVILRRTGTPEQPTILFRLCVPCRPPRESLTSRTAWRREGDSNPRDPLRFDRRKLSRVWRTIRPRTKASLLERICSLGIRLFLRKHLIAQSFSAQNWSARLTEATNPR
jgi:hypothetical protein